MQSRALPWRTLKELHFSHSLQAMSEESACAVDISFPNTWFLVFVMQGLGLAFLPMLLPAEVGIVAVIQENQLFTEG